MFESNSLLLSEVFTEMLGDTSDILFLPYMMLRVAFVQEAERNQANMHEKFGGSEKHFGALLAPAFVSAISSCVSFCYVILNGVK